MRKRTKESGADARSRKLDGPTTVRLFCARADTVTSRSTAKAGQTIVRVALATAVGSPGRSPDFPPVANFTLLAVDANH